MHLPHAVLLAVAVTLLALAGGANADCITSTRFYSDSFIWTYRCVIPGYRGEQCVYCGATMTGAFIGTLVGMSIGLSLLFMLLIFIRRLVCFSFCPWNVHYASYHVESMYQPIVVTHQSVPVYQQAAPVYQQAAPVYQQAAPVYYTPQ